MFNLKSQEQGNKLELVEKSGDVFQEVLNEAGNIEINSSVDRNEKGKLLTEDRATVSLLQNELYWKIIRTPAFKKWFGDSVVKDENGEPKVVYRSSLLKNFDISNPFQPNAQTWQENHYGTFFTSSRERSIQWFETSYKDNAEYKDYHGDKDVFLARRDEFLKDHEKQVKVFSAFIKLEHPYIEKGYFNQGRSNPSIGDFKNRFIKGGDEFLKTLEGNDGLYMPVSSDYDDEYAVLNTENIFILPSDTSSKE